MECHSGYLWLMWIVEYHYGRNLRITTLKKYVSVVRFVGIYNNSISTRTSRHVRCGGWKGRGSRLRKGMGDASIIDAACWCPAEMMVDILGRRMLSWWNSMVDYHGRRCRVFLSWAMWISWVNVQYHGEYLGQIS